jgi:hypothetical protein
MEDAVRKIALKTEAIGMPIFKILIGRLKCALLARVLVGISSSGWSLLARKGVLSELSAILWELKRYQR